MTATAETVKQILVVEDDELAREIVGLFLEAEGYEVSTASNGREALDYLQTHEHPCLILLDLMMPVMTGWEFREEQQRDADLAAIPVVVITAVGNVSSEHELGAVAWITKPYEMDELLATLTQCC